MTTLFAPPELLSAWSYAVDGADPDEPLPKGTHLRVFGGLGGTFPLAPFAVFKVGTHGSDTRLHFSDDRGRPIAGPALSGARTADLTPVFADDETRRTVRVELFPDQPDGLEDAQLLDAHGRLIAERRRPRFLFSAPTLSRFRLRGDVGSMELGSRFVSIEELEKEQPPVAAVLGLPVEGAHPWYVGVHDHDAGMKRVFDGAPLRLNPMDRPDGPFDAAGPDDEVARVEATLASVIFGDGLEGLLASMVDDETTAPWRQIERQPLGDREQIADVPRVGSLQMAAIDPGLARFLGFADRLDDLPDLDRDEGWTALAVVGLLAIDPELGQRLPHLAAWLAHPDSEERRLVEMIARAIGETTGQDLSAALDGLIRDARQRGFMVRTMVAVTAPVPPWLAPTLPQPDLLDHRWQASDGITESALYRATFSFASAPLAAMAAVGGNFDGNWVSRHGAVPVGGAFTARATARIFGHETDPSSRVRQLLKAGTSAVLESAGILADEDLPADAGTLSYRFRASDFFGRFGDPVEITIDPPPRPAPPPPVIRYHLDLHSDDLEQVPAAGPLSPGTLQLTLAVPQPPPADPFSSADEARLRTAIAVPGLHGLAAGSRPIKSVRITLDGDDHDVDVSSPGLVDLPLPLAELGPQAQGQVELAATFRDSADIPSEPASVTFAVTDKRALRPIETGIGLFWTSAPGPGPDVQLKLAWQTTPNALHRVYATDQQGLGLTNAELAEHVPGAAPSRARVAEVGANKVLGGAPIDRKVFRLLAETVEADGTGLAVLETMLPRSLETVQFLRIVPLSSEGAEAPFDRCGIVPVAVPDSRRPPPPRLDGTVDMATGLASFVVIAEGFDGVALRRDEPGLFDSPVGPAVAPSFRIRRAVGAIADPIYARQVAEGLLAHDASQDPAVVFRSTPPEATDGPLEPFVRYVYWAEVRLPPERRLPVGVTPLDAGVTALDPANAADHPRPVSLPSAPRTLMRTPPDPPDAPEPGHVLVTPIATIGGEIQFAIDVTDPPTAHPKAIGPFRLAVWSQWPGGSIRAIAIANDVPLDGAWPDITSGSITITVQSPDSPAAPAGPITIRVAYVDPTGRLGELTTIAVP
jgi:hypothetical protein